MMIHLVTFETRDVLGRIVEEVDSAFLDEDNAEARAGVINGDPVTYPGMVADVKELPIRDWHVAVAETGRTGKPNRLTAEKVREIRRRYATGEIMTVLARSYGVNVATISDVINGKTWRHA